MATLLALPAAASGATLAVTTTSDEYGAGAACSLREAVEAARDNAPFGGCAAGDVAAVDTVVLGAGSYALTRADVAAADESGNATGDLDVIAGGALTISGAGRATTTISTALGNRLVHDFAASALTFERLTLDGGDVTAEAGQDAWGASIRSLGGTVTLDDVRVTGGKAELAGAIYTANSTVLRIEDSTIDGNSARLGGALGTANSTVATIERSAIRDNDAVAGAGDDAEGGAIRHAAQSGSLTISDSELTGNQATNSGGGASDWASGGGIHSNAPLTIARSLLAGNEASATGGTVEHGGALYTLAGASVVNSTFYDNAAHGPNGRGGALYSLGGTVHVRHVTFLRNGSVAGGDDLYGSGGTMSVGASLLPGVAAFGNDPCGGDVVTSSGYNVAHFIDPQCGYVASDVTTGGTGVNTAVSEPESHGGPTPTIEILAASTAVDAVPIAACGAAGGTDQRGAPWVRPHGGACDAGAFELQPPPPPPPVPGDPGDPGGPGTGGPGAPPVAAPKPLPSNAFRFGKLTRRPAKGTATLVAHVPGAGRLVLARTGKVERQVKRPRRGGPVRLTIRPRGGALRKLDRDGSVRAKLRVVFTPNGGKARTRSKTVKLVKRLD